MSVTAKLAAATFTLAAATIGFEVQAAPVSPATIAANTAPAIAATAGTICYPRFVWTYRVGFGRRLISIGTICIPTLAHTVPLPGPGPLARPDRVIPNPALY